MIIKYKIVNIQKIDIHLSRIDQINSLNNHCLRPESEYHLMKPTDRPELFFELNFPFPFSSNFPMGHQWDSIEGADDS